MMMKKTLAFLLATLILLSLMPLSLAEGRLILGDGAPIPYLKGFTSRLIKDAAMLPGITGQTDIRIHQEDGRTQNKQGQIAIHIQNIALTDDAMAVFYRAEFPDFLPLEYGSAQESYDQAAPFVMPYINGEHLPHVNIWEEGHPDGDKALQCLAVLTLENPVPDGAMLSFGDASPVRIDRSQAKDPTRAVKPKQQITLNYERFSGKAITFQATIARVSFGPFGNRILVLNRDDGRSGIDALPCVLEDEAGKRLPMILTGYQGSSLASPVNPIEVHNEVYFLGGEDMTTLRLIPYQDMEKDREKPLPAALPLTGPFPARVPLSNGAEMTIHAVQINENGCTIHHSATGPDYVTFEVGDADHKPIQKLNEQAVTFDGYDLKAQALVSSLLWVSEYKGQPVSRVSDTDIKQAHTLLVSGSWRYETRTLPDLAVEVPLK